MCQVILNSHNKCGACRDYASVLLKLRLLHLPMFVTAKAGLGHACRHPGSKQARTCVVVSLQQACLLNLNMNVRHTKALRACTACVYCLLQLKAACAGMTLVHLCVAALETWLSLLVKQQHRLRERLASGCFRAHQHVDQLLAAPWRMHPAASRRTWRL